MSEEQPSPIAPKDEKTHHKPAKGKNGSAGAPSEPLLIVGIGASAGGMEALTRFCEALPKKPDAAFVIIQHLDPNHTSLMPELLSRHTSLPVRQVGDRVRVKLNTIYIIPPGKYIGLRDSHLELQDPPENRLHTAAIDHFFQTLAEVQKERAVCVVLSGTGNDGTEGLKAIKGAGGLVLVQKPESAQHPEMPRSAIATGTVDRIATPEEMAKLIEKYARHTDVAAPGSDPGPSLDDEGYSAVLAHLHTKTGHQFAYYKSNTLHRRIHRRMSLHHLESVADYLKLLRKHPSEIESLFRDLLIGVTSFFREPEAWHKIEHDVLPGLLGKCSEREALRVWTPGCSTGEEAYTTAIVISEAIARSGRSIPFFIFATDIDKNVFGNARTGIYPANISANVSDQYIEKYFNQIDDHYEVKKELREHVIFAPQSLIHDPPFSRLNLVICRNVLIYLENDVQRKIIRLFHFALRDQGTLFLGPSETVGTKKDLFKPVSKKWRIYQKVGSTRTGAVAMPIVEGVSRQVQSTLPAPRSQRRGTPKSIAHEALVNEFAPAAVLIDRDFNILYHHGPRHEYLQTPQGEPTDNLLDHARSGLRQKLRNLLARATETNQRIEAEDGRVKCDDGTFRKVRLAVIPLVHTQEAEGTILVTFSGCQPDSPTAPATPPSPSHESEMSQLENELKATRLELQSTIEELETSNEELKASNEEIMSMNEELQSTNEELETSKEELQSLNEELTTVNNELHEKVDELELTNDDLDNLLSSTSIATLFLDRKLNVKRFTPPLTELFHLLPNDVGRPITHIAHRLDNTTLAADAREVLDTLVASEKEVKSENNNWFVQRILPYRTQDDRIAGVVIAFINVTIHKQAEQALREGESRVRRIIDNQLAFVGVLKPDGTMEDVNEPALEAGGINREQVVGQKFWDCYWCAYDNEVQSRIIADIELARRGETVRRDEVFRIAEDGRLAIDFMIQPVVNSDGEVTHLIPSGVDISDRKAAEEELAARESQFKRAVLDSPVPVVLYADDGEILMLSNAWTETTGYTIEEVPTIDIWTRMAYGEKSVDAREYIEKLYDLDKRVDEGEFTIRCKNGEQRIWRFSSSPLGRGADGRRLIISKAMDVTDLKQASERLEQLNRTLEQKVIERTSELETTGERLRHLAHELARTEHRERRRLAATLHDNLQQLIAVARMQIGRLPNMDAAQASSLIADISTSLDQAAEVCRTLTTELAPPVLYDDGLFAALRWLTSWMETKYGLKIACDFDDSVESPDQEASVLLFQSVRELLFNVVKHAGTTEATLAVNAPEPGWLRIVISDNGRGFRREEVEARVNNDKGFGLFSIKERVAVLGGRMEIDDSAGGATVKLIVPVPPAEDDPEAPGNIDAAKPIAPPDESEQIRVLLVDDHVLSRKGLAQLVNSHADLKLVGEASDGQEALEMSRRFRPHVVIMDVNMPRMNGVEATRRITREMTGIRVIGLSVQADQGTRDSMINAGAKGMVTKGGPPEELWQIIRDVSRSVDKPD